MGRKGVKRIHKIKPLSIGQRELNSFEPHLSLIKGFSHHEGWDHKTFANDTEVYKPGSTSLVWITDIRKYFSTATAVQCQEQNMFVLKADRQKYHKTISIYIFGTGYT